MDRLQLVFAVCPLIEILQFHLSALLVVALLDLYCTGACGDFWGRVDLMVVEAPVYEGSVVMRPGVSVLCCSVPVETRVCLLQGCFHLVKTVIALVY